MSKIYRFKLDKLIRDNMPNVFRQLNAHIVERIMEHDEYTQRLKDKLLEEATEVVNAKTEDEIREELADVLEILQTIAHIHHIDFTEIEKRADQKRAVKGGFHHRVYGEFIEIEEGHPDIPYYRANADRYPEIKREEICDIH